MRPLADEPLPWSHFFALPCVAAAMFSIRKQVKTSLLGQDTPPPSTTCEGGGASNGEAVEFDLFPRQAVCHVVSARGRNPNPRQVSGVEVR